VDYRRVGYRDEERGRCTLLTMLSLGASGRGGERKPMRGDWGVDAIEVF